jgi:hypothetical protein
MSAVVRNCCIIGALSRAMKTSIQANGENWRELNQVSEHLRLAALLAR